MAVYAVFRPRSWNMSLRERIEAALAEYRAERGTIPEGLVVNPREVEAARRVVAELGLGLKVKPVGGCLIPKVWLIVDGTSVRKKG